MKIDAEYTHRVPEQQSAHVAAKRKKKSRLQDTSRNLKLALALIAIVLLAGITIIRHLAFEQLAVERKRLLTPRAQAVNDKANRVISDWLSILDDSRRYTSSNSLANLHARANCPGLVYAFLQHNQRAITSYPSDLDTSDIEKTLSTSNKVAIIKDKIVVWDSIQSSSGKRRIGLVLESGEFISKLMDAINLGENEHLTLLSPGTPHSQIKSTAQSLLSQDNLILSSKLSAHLDGMILNYYSSEGSLKNTKRAIDACLVLVSVILLLSLMQFGRIAESELRFALERSQSLQAVTHELKTPLTAFHMYAELLLTEQGKDPIKRERYVTHILKETERLNHLISDVLAVESESVSGNRVKEFSVSELMLRIEERLAPMLSAEGFKLQVHKDPKAQDDILMVNLDSFLTIFVNLTDNALKYAKGYDPQVIRLACEVMHDSKGKKTLRFSFRDFGPGIEKEHMEQIFEPYFRGEDQSVRATKGTGLGLAAAKRLAELMQADLSCETHSEGASFALSFKEI